MNNKQIFRPHFEAVENQKAYTVCVKVEGAVQPILNSAEQCKTQKFKN